MADSALSPARRRDDLERLGHEAFDILVVGGGVTGAGTALDATTRGLRVALVEAQDWASGTSSRSSKLVHGGLRYLQQLDFHLVREALLERSRLLGEIAPHLVHPVAFLYPLRSPIVERAYVGAGIALYDALAWSSRRTGGLPRHRHLSRHHALQLAPGLRRDSLAGAIQYYDAQVDDARYVLETVRTAVAFGAVALNRVAVIGFRRDGDRVCGVRARDTETGAELDVSAKVTVVATGPWTEDTEAIAGRARAVKVRPSKGVHLVVPKDKIASSAALVVRTERSVLFVLPWGEHWLIGTTDTDWDDEKARPVTTRADVDYLLSHVNRVLSHPLRAEDVEVTYAGLRPLVAGVGVVRGPGEAGAERIDRMARGEPQTTKVSREHAVARPMPGLVVISGGKFTTYRVMAADAVDAAVADGSLHVGGSITGSVRLLGAEDYEIWRNRLPVEAVAHAVPESLAGHLFGRYGALAGEVLDLIDNDRTLAQEVPGAPGYVMAEIVYAVSHEGARHLDDVLLRRTRAGMETPDAAEAAAEAVAGAMAPMLGWDAAVLAAEVDAYRQTAALEYLAADRPADDAEAARWAKETPPLLPVP
jgi:glycerol-3-phosphate dehydrogenase